jgi:hypothetical protein
MLTRRALARSLRAGKNGFFTMASSVAAPRLTQAEQMDDGGADIGVIAVCTPGDRPSAPPHVHCVVSGRRHLGGRQALDCLQSRVLSSVRVLSRLFRRLFLEGLTTAFEAGELQFFGDLTHLSQAEAFAATLKSSRTAEWVSMPKEPSAVRSCYWYTWLGTRIALRSSLAACSFQ